MRRHGRIACLMALLAPLAMASTYNDFHSSLMRIKSQIDGRQGRDTIGYNGEAVEKWQTIFPKTPTTIENVPISCENDDRNYCNYPDLVPFESTSIQEIMKFPIPSGRCPDGYSRVPTFDCLNFAPALFETTCCVYNAPPPQPVQMCPIDENNVVINALAKLCDGRILLVTYLKQESRQVVWQLDSNLKLNRSTPYRVDDVTGNAVNGDDNQILGTVPNGDCGIDWVYRNLNNDRIKVVTVSYMGKITAGMKQNIDTANGGFEDLGDLRPVVVKGSTNTSPDSNSVYAGFGLGKNWAFVSFLNVKETGLDRCTTFVRVNHWLFDNAAMNNWQRVKLWPIVSSSGGGAASTTSAPSSSSSRPYGQDTSSSSSSGGSGAGGSGGSTSTTLTQLAQDLAACVFKGLYYDDVRDVIVGVTASGKVTYYQRNGKLSSESSTQLGLNNIVCNMQLPSTPAPANATTASPEIVVYVPIPYQQYPNGGGYGSGSTYGQQPQQPAYQSPPAQTPTRPAAYRTGGNVDEDDTTYLQGRKPGSYRYQRRD